MTAKVIEFKSESIPEVIDILDNAIKEMDESKKPWLMTQAEIKTAHADGDISLNTYIKWAIRFDHGGAITEGKLKEIDCETMANRWSYEIYNTKNKLKLLELYSTDVLRVILVLSEKGWFGKVVTDRQIELDLFPQKH